VPYKSKAQQGYMHAAAERGDVPRSVVDKFDRASKGQHGLPYKVSKGGDDPPEDPRHAVLVEIHAMAQKHLGHHLASKKEVPTAEPGPPEAEPEEMRHLMEIEETQKKKKE
jgi:hypothetical protein